MEITKQQLVSDLRNLGIKQNDIVYVHSSLKQIGWIQGGPVTLVEAFLEVLGEGGTLAVPTHTYSYPGNEYAPYDHANSPSLVGAFTEAVRKYPGAYRSMHPSHSSAAIGAKAKFLTSNHCMSNPVSEETVLRRIYKDGGKVLLLGVGQTSNTSLHMAEAMSGVCYTALPYDPSWGTSAYRIGSSGDVEYIPQEEFPGCSSHFYIMEGLFKMNGMIQYGTVGNAVCQLMDAKKMIDMTVAMIKEKPDLLLCYNPKCHTCASRREFLSKRHENIFIHAYKKMQ
jgi:aminoglycoside 3-N-acetyltransferase